LVRCTNTGRAPGHADALKGAALFYEGRLRGLIRRRPIYIW
jgi:hypothetical protein